MKIFLFLPLLVLVSCKQVPVNYPAKDYEGWTTYAGTKDGSIYQFNYQRRRELRLFGASEI